MAIQRDAAIGMLDVAGGKIERIDIGDAAGAVDDAVGLGRVFGTVMGEDTRRRPLAGSMRLTLTPVLTRMPMRSLSVWRRATASASIAGNNCGSASRIVTSAPARA